MSQESTEAYACALVYVRVCMRLQVVMPSWQWHKKFGLFRLGALQLRTVCPRVLTTRPSTPAGARCYRPDHLSGPPVHCGRPSACRRGMATQPPRPPRSRIRANKPPRQIPLGLPPRLLNWLSSRGGVDVNETIAGV